MPAILTPPTQPSREANLTAQFLSVRKLTEEICAPLQTEDYVVQPTGDVSPPKWHLGHTTWFFETLILKTYRECYAEYNPNFNFVFNSYYESLGTRVVRTQRGNLSRPTVDEIFRYRKHVDNAMVALLQQPLADDLHYLITLGCHHEQQHQELLWTDIKFILGHNPLLPAYDENIHIEITAPPSPPSSVAMMEGVYEIGYEGDAFCYDNELGRHKVYLPSYAIATSLITNEEYLAFIADGGYRNFVHWHAEGWDWVKTQGIEAPLYWYRQHDQWFHYTLRGFVPVDLQQPVTHVSYYEAAAFAVWSGKRLPTEFEWEAAAPNFAWGHRWEWTESAYLPYPGFVRAPGAVGEYNGKFMVNQKVLRGASAFTSPEHGRITYRNFFHPHLRWQLTGIRLAH
ncbi:ergothioneine biosynthesis protein EgtB [Chryseolinea lacunae]|uniref:Ergothioneine biosynthesis protein EgtB n=1 Tax=Chryseolinea lacunae TaxID=2801331 RepID=A0ABS1L0V6_9BACT|nr:ergothioneine biosynthesis protein EgtB [Chryseolinea lacunae]MBL0745338.1 ergothioneine biosynthesis protein EgtB [Chryseolinea lacunae]